MLKRHKRMPSLHRLLTNSSFLHPKWEETPPQISPGCHFIAIKRTELSRALWKAVGLELSGIKTPTAECVSGSHLLCRLCTRLCCRSCPGVVCLEWMEGTNSSHNVSCCYFFISCIPHLTGCLSHLGLWRCGSGLRWIDISLWISPSKCCLINKPATFQSPHFQPSVQFWSFLAEPALCVRQLLQNVLKVAKELQVESCGWLAAEVPLMQTMLLLF